MMNSRFSHRRSVIYILSVCKLIMLKKASRFQMEFREYSKWRER